MIALLVLVIPVSHRATVPSGAARVLEIQSAEGLQRVDADADVALRVRGPAGVSVVRLAERRAWIERAPCRNRLCQRMGTLRAPGRSLVCIPNQLVVRFSGAADDAPADAITR